MNDYEDDYADENDYFEESRFYCDHCGHNFCMEVEEDMPQPKFCIFCSSPVQLRKDEYEDEDE